MSSNLKREGGGNSGGDSSKPTHVLLHPSQVPYSHYTTSTRGSMSNGFVELYRDDEDRASGLDYQHSHSAPHSTANSRRGSLNFAQRRSRSRPSTPPVELGRGSNDSDYWSGYGIDLGGGLSPSSSSSSLGGLPGIGHERLGHGRLRMLGIHRLQSSRRKGMNIWKLLLRVLGGLGLAWIAFGLVRIGASRVRIIYSHWVRPPYLSLPLTNGVTDVIVMIICACISTFTHTWSNGSADEYPSRTSRPLQRPRMDISPTNPSRHRPINGGIVHQPALLRVNLLRNPG